MTKATERDARYARYLEVLTAAHAAADNAQAGMVENMNAFDCGFAWAIVHDQAFSRWCAAKAKESGNRAFYGSKHYSTGWSFWKPGRFNGQSIGIHEAGARAFRDSLAHALQCNVEMGSRLD
jgi:hypothetical protein